MLYPEKPKVVVDNFICNKLLEINVFLDKKSGFLEDMLKYALNLDYGNDGSNIILNIYNGYSKNKWIKDWVIEYIKQTNIPKCSIHFINFNELDKDIEIQTKNLREKAIRRKEY